MTVCCQIHGYNTFFPELPLCLLICKVKVSGGGHTHTHSFERYLHILSHHLLSVHLCIDHRGLVPHQKRPRSGAPPETGSPRAACTGSLRSLHTSWARKDWIWYLCSFLTGPHCSSLWTRKIIVITFILMNKIIGFTQSVPSQKSPHNTSASSIFPFSLLFVYFCLLQTC